MLESDSADPNAKTDTTTPTPAATAASAPRKRAPRKAAAKSPATAASDPAPAHDPNGDSDKTVAEAPRKRAPRKAAKAAVADGAENASPTAPAEDDPSGAGKAPAKKTGARAAKKASAPADTDPAAPAAAAKPARKRASRQTAAPDVVKDATPDQLAADEATTGRIGTAERGAPGVLFVAPAEDAPKRRRPAKKVAAAAPSGAEPAADGPDVTAAEDVEDQVAEPEDIREAAIEQASGARRRRRRGRRGRGGNAGDGADATDDDPIDESTDDAPEDRTDVSADSQAGGRQSGGRQSGDRQSGDRQSGDGQGQQSVAAVDDQQEDSSGEAEASTSSRRRRRRRSGGTGADGGNDDPPNTVTHVRETKRGEGDDGVRGVKGSTRLEAKRQRRRDGRETTRRRAPILSEAEFLARRESVDRVMAVRQTGDRTQIAVLEDGILVEHYVTRASATSYVGNVYLGRVQNVLPSMEAAFVDVAKGRNGVLYAGEVNWDAAGLDGKSRAIENAMKSGDSVLVQVTKDPIGHKGARLTSQVSLPGRYVVYVPGGGMTGISRRLPDNERHRLKSILKKIVPDEAGVIVRTAAEGASEEDLTRDVERLRGQWDAIEIAAKSGSPAPMLVHGEPDLAIRVVRDVFNEDFASLVVQGEDAWQTVSEYVGGVAPDLAERATRHSAATDLFHELRVDEQLMKALDRKVWLPSGGSLVIDRTEAMTVIDVNTGKFVGSGGNLEQTVTRNNLEAAEEIVRQLRLRDVGGIIVIDFIDMVLESNRELVLRRLTECLGRDRTKHQVAEVTSLGLVQMTRKRVGEGLLEAFSETCEHCNGRGVLVHSEPVDQPRGGDDEVDRAQSKQGKRRRGGRGGTADPVDVVQEPSATQEQRQAANAAIAAIHRAAALEAAAETADGSADLATDLGSAPAEDSQLSPTRAAVAAVAAVEIAPTHRETAPEPEPETAFEPETAEANGAPAQRRRRRSASRPAGPPVLAG